ncbi:hypothetical protein CFAM422_004386 [Trichoderma lentiforme]|uniref:NB-ARC domain-containing protein n=1 Tax=Trichoderma lentiforme TaxID=1567552 RepID=A0A9P5CGH4_9HYPO|nr:hypothetical protein CFAM422_004386 [Trichoderma lentiforme]
MKRKARSHLRNIRNNRLRNIRNNRLRNIGNNRFRNNNVITQGDTNIYMSDRPARAAIHVIAYPPNEDFIKRPDIVDKLDQLLPRSSGYHSAALCGLGGTGKTQIALDYIYRQCGTRSVFWVHADTKATIINDYKTIAKKLGIMDKQLDDEALLMAVCSRIEEEPEWLLVLDNADDLSLFGVGPASTSSKSLPNCVPRGPKGVVLWTSRDKRIMGTLVSPLRVIEVGDMSLEEAKKLLALATATIQTEASSEDTKDIDKLLENLQYHALAISQAGAYMRRTSTPVRDYLAMLSKKQKRQKLLEKSEFDRHRKSGAPNSILDTWSISIRRIQQESEQAFHLFHIMVYFDCQSIPESLVEIVGIGCHLKDDELKEAITRLGEFYLIYQRKDEHGCAIYEIHKLVQEAARYGLRRRNLLDKGLTTINISDVPREREEDSEDSEETYYAMYALYIMGFLSEKLQETGQTWALGDAYLTHVLQIVEWMDIFEEKVIVLTDLLLVAGLLGRLRRWKDKELLVKRALTMTRKMLGEEHPDTMKCMHALAISYLGQAFGLRDTGPLQFDFDSWFKGAQELCGEAEKIGKQLVKLGRKISEPTDREKIASLKLMADVYCGQEKYNKAKVFTRRILRLQWKEHGLKHPSTLTAMEDLARVFYFHDTPGLRKRALRVREKILEFQKETTGEKTPTTIYAMYNLATSLKRCGRLRDAITLMNQCCRLSKEVFVGGHDMIFECRWLAAYWRLELSKDDKDGIQ